MTTTIAAPAAAAPAATATPAAAAPAATAAPNPATQNTAAALAGTPTAAGAPAATTETVNPGSWMAGLNDDTRGYLQTKGFKDTAALADSYRHLEKLMGAPKERLLTLPEKFYDDKGALTAEGRGIYERLGMPKEAKDYALQVPAEHGDPKLMEHFSKVFHDAGIPKAAAEKITASWNEYQGAARTAMAEQQAQAFKDQDAELARSWGAAKEQNTNIAKDAVRTLGMTADEVNGISAAIGHAKTMELFLKLGKSVGEDLYVGGKPAADRLLEPASARHQINQLKQDRHFQEQFNAGNQEAIQKWTRLHEMEAAGQMVPV